jgi:hypothetical protein
VNPLELCTDPPAMAELLQRSLPGFADGQARIETVHVHKARRSSSIARNPNPITLCYDLAVRDRSRRGSLRLYAKMFRDGASAQCFAAIDAKELEAPAWGEALVHLSALDMVLWALPNDPGLPQLTALLDPVQLHPLLPWTALGVDPFRARGLDVDLLRQSPSSAPPCAAPSSSTGPRGRSCCSRRRSPIRAGARSTSASITSGARRKSTRPPRSWRDRSAGTNARARFGKPAPAAPRCAKR